MNHEQIVKQGIATGANYRRSARGKVCLASADDVGQETWIGVAIQGKDVRLSAYTAARANVRDTSRMMYGRWGEGRATPRSGSIPLESMAGRGTPTTLLDILDDLRRDKPILADVARLLASGSSQSDCGELLGVSQQYISKLVGVLRDYLSPSKE